jgi:hypothetical protein
VFRFIGKLLADRIMDAGSGKSVKKKKARPRISPIRDNKYSVSCFFSKIVSRRSLECASLRASNLAGAFAANYS